MAVLSVNLSRVLAAKDLNILKECSGVSIDADSAQ
jgi:hypothetical protein